MTQPTPMEAMQGQPQQPPIEERTPDQPNTQTPQENQDASGLTEDLKKALLDVKKKYKDKWRTSRLQKIRNVSRNFEYIKDNQYIIWDPFTGRFVNPFEQANQGTESGQDDLDIYRYVNNVIQWLERVFTSVLSQQVPKTRYWPDNADDENDINAADEASKVQAKIERQNNAKSLLKQQLLYLFASGNYFRYTRYLRSADRAGTSQEPIWTLQDTEIKPERYQCPSCGAEIPMAQMSSPNCPQCGHALGEDDYREAVSVPLPVIADYKDVPNGQVCWSLYNTLHVDMAPYPTEDTVDPLTQTPLFDLENEADIAAIRASYPGAWDVLKGGSSKSGAQGEEQEARSARQRIFTNAWGKGEFSPDVMPTFSRCWFRAWSFNILDDKATADKLRELFPNGCKVVSVGDTVLEASPEKLTDHWSWCGTRKGMGAYPPAVCDPAIPFQDRINDIANNTHNYYDRLSNPDVIVNSAIFDGPALNGQSMSGGGYKLVKLKTGIGGAQKLQDSMWQPEFHTDQSVFRYGDVLMQTLQLIIGTTPQTYGGHQEGVDTFGGQKQALDVASGILSTYWELVSEENANASKISVKCYAANADGDDHVVTESADEDQKFANQTIEIDKLQGEFQCYPDDAQGLPVSGAEMRERLEEMVNQGAKNPLIQTMFDLMPNRKLFAKSLLPAGIEVPGQNAWNKVMQDIAKLIEGRAMPPVMQQTPMGPQMIQLPSVLPDKLVDDLDMSLQACKEWGQKNYYKVQKQNPAGWQNFLLYLKLVAQFQAETQMAAMPPPQAAPQGATA